MRNCAVCLMFLTARHFVCPARYWRPRITGRLKIRIQRRQRLCGFQRPPAAHRHDPSANTTDDASNRAALQREQGLRPRDHYRHRQLLAVHTRSVGPLLEDDFRCRLTGIERFDGDGIIADFDDPAVARRCAIVHCRWSLWDRHSRTRRNIPGFTLYRNGQQQARLARVHASDWRGLEHFALYSLPQAQENRWAQQRELAFAHLRNADGHSAEQIQSEIYRGLSTSAPSWNQATEQLTAWLRELPKPVGIIAVTDARARHLLQACLIAGIPVPEEVAIIGIDNDPLTRTLTRIPLSSVIQGTVENGPHRGSPVASDAAWRALSWAAHSRAACWHQRTRIDRASAARESLCNARAAFYSPVCLHRVFALNRWPTMSASSPSRSKSTFDASASARCIRRSCATSSMSGESAACENAMRRARKWQYVAALRRCTTCTPYFVGKPYAARVRSGELPA